MSVNGYSAPTGRELKEEYETTLNANLSNASLDFEPGTVPGALSAAATEVLGDLAEKTQELYDQRRIQNATDLDLNDLAKIAGITRQEATQSTVELEANVSSGPVDIPTSTEVRGPNGNKWTVDETGPVESPTNTVTFICQTPGPVTVAANSSWTIITPVSGVTGFDNPSPANAGQPRETDRELLLRRNEQFAIGTTRQIGSLRAALSDLDFLNHNVVVENRSDTEQTVEGFTIDPHSFVVVVEPSNLSADEEQEVARTIYDFGPEAINPDPDQPNSATVDAIDGTSYEVYWSEAITVQVDVEVDLSTTFSSDPTRLSELESQIASNIQSSFDDLDVGERVFEPGVTADAIDVEDQAGISAIEITFVRVDTSTTYTDSVPIGPTEVSTPGNVTYV